MANTKRVLTLSVIFALAIAILVSTTAYATERLPVTYDMPGESVDDSKVEVNAMAEEDTLEIEAEAIDSSSVPNRTSIVSITTSKKECSVGDTVDIAYRFNDAAAVARVKKLRLYHPGGYGSMLSLKSPPSNPCASSFPWFVTAQMLVETKANSKWQVACIETLDQKGYVTRIWDRAYVSRFGSSISGEEADEATLAVGDLSESAFEVKWSVDPHPATLESIEASMKTCTLGNTQKFKYKIDDPDGVTWVSSLRLHQPGTEGLWTFDGPGTGSEFSLKVNSLLKAGNWRVVGMEVCDKLGYVTQIWDSAYASEHDTRLSQVESTGLSYSEADMSGSDFTLDYSVDPHAASLLSISAEKDECGVGDTQTLNYQLADEDGLSFVYRLGLYQPGRGGSILVFPNLSTDTRLTSFPLDVTSDITPGMWRVAFIEVIDQKGYVTRIWDSAYKKQHGTTLIDGGADGATVVEADLSDSEFKIIGSTDSQKYKIVEGDKGVHALGSASGLVFRVNAPFDLFDFVAVDNSILPTKDYRVEAGSTVVTLESPFLDSLGLGEHEIDVHFTDGGVASGTFTVRAPEAESNDAGTGAARGDNEPDDTETGTEASLKSAASDSGRSSAKLANTGDCSSNAGAAVLLAVGAFVVTSGVIGARKGC